MGCHPGAWDTTPSFGGNVPDHIKAGFPTTAAACAQCHTITKWADGKFDHTAFGFPLTNSHALVADGGKVPSCASCHINNNYSLTTLLSDCGNSGCHLTTWNQTNNPTHSTSGPTFAVANCSTCHNTISWTTAAFDHSTTGWALTGSHQMAPAGKVVACTDCHVGNNYTFTVANTDCYGCHQAAWQSTTTMGGVVPNHVTAGFPTAQCSTCHNTNTWTSTFNHATTGFPLTNSHQMAPAGKVVACTDCHINNNYTLATAPTDCGNSGCHLTTWQQTNNPTPSSAGAPYAAANCSTCHSTITWTTATFDHSTTGWALTGSHQMAPAGKVVACTDCHVGNNYTFTVANTDCYGCHQAAWQSTTTMGGVVPNHVAAGFPTSQCSTCHTTTTWTSTFNHAITGFPLTNSHQMAPAGKAATCASCHINNNYTLTIAPTDCGNSGCHLTTWQTTNNPKHPSAGAPFAAANCSTCHNTITWTTATFDHSTTGWALTGSHQMAPAGKVVACTDCHVGNNYTFTAANTDCYGCHQVAWQSTTTLGGGVPNHVAAGFPTSQCSTRHTTTTWTSTFNHATTGFPSTNSHQMAPAGKAATCASCHINNNYTLTIALTDCGNSGCHLTTWQTTNNPKHPSAGAPFAAANCSTCHNTITWTTATFDHSTTGWALTGSHQMAPAGKVVACTDCHVGNNYTFTAANTDCYGCHQVAWQSTTTLGGVVPNHVTAGFPTSQCSTCHNTNTWTSTFNHATTGFPLTNSHQMAPAGKAATCASCHINNNYTLTIAPTDCGNSGCHLTTWQQTNNPTHSSAGAPYAAANCSTCHNTITWTTATFDHSTTGFALTGSHQMAPAGKVVACTDCHVGNNYTFTAANTDCLGCHQTAWQSTQTLGGNVPNHITANFPTSQCSTCHTTTTWTSTFNHATTGFPLTNSHQMAPAGKAATCAFCHINNNYTLATAPTDCGNSGCHLTTWQQTNNPTHSSAGAPYAAANCSTCHNTITWTTATFDHSTAGFALTGSHQMAPAGKVVACTDCHVGNIYTFTAANTDCYGCHQVAWQSTTTLGGVVPNHITSGFPTSQCALCHDTLLWADGKFDHSTTGWPLQGAHVTTPCSSCHLGANPFGLT